jgi:hypothetical protein
MSGGGARPNQFRVVLTFPPFVGASSNPAGTAAQFLCKSASLPASTIEDVQMMYRGRAVHFAGERSYQPWSVSIYNDTNFQIRNTLERWSNGILNYTQTNGILRPSDYQVDLTVHQLDRNDMVIKTYRFYDAYPIEIGQIALDYESNNQVEVFDVQFQFNYFNTTDK